jgi:hypothetical protein
MDTLAVATIHDHWAEDTVSDHGLVALKLWVRHLAKRHPIASGGLFVLEPAARRPQSRNAYATISAEVRLRCMTQLTLQLAATHDHWFEEPAAKHAFPALMLWWRHLAKQHPIIADGIEWTGCGTIAIAVLCGSLIANG